MFPSRMMTLARSIEVSGPIVTGSACMISRTNMDYLPGNDGDAPAARIRSCRRDP